MLCDTHTHSKYSFDGAESIEDMCLAAIEKGVSVLTITDHSEAMEQVPYNDIERARILGAKEEVEAARIKFAGKIDLLFGCELGQPHMNPEYAKKVLEEFEFDYILGSLHFFKGNVDLYDVKYTPENVDFYIKTYFAENKEMIEHGKFHTLGHLDYIMRRFKDCYSGLPTYKGYEDTVEEILQMLVDRDMGLEINTSGLRKWMGELGMEVWVLEMYRKLGGKYITIGSDAHAKQDIGAGFDNACKLIKTAGFSEFTYFKNSEPIKVSI